MSADSHKLSNALLWLKTLYVAGVILAAAIGIGATAFLAACATPPVPPAYRYPEPIFTASVKAP